MGAGATFSSVSLGCSNWGRGKFWTPVKPAISGAFTTTSTSGGASAGVGDGGRFAGHVGAGGWKLRGAGLASMELRTSNSCVTLP